MDRPDIKALMLRAADKALSIQQPLVRAHVRRIRRLRPDATPAEVVKALEKHYLSTVATLGLANGAVAATPGGGTAVATALAMVEIPSYIEATTLFTLAVAEVHDVHVADLEHRRMLVMAVLLGNAGVETVREMSGRTGKHWARKLLGAVSGEQLKRINKVLGHNFVTKQGKKQGILVLGRDVPFGFGAVIGAGGNYVLGKGSVKAARTAFGPAPRAWPDAAASAPHDEPEDGARDSDPRAPSGTGKVTGD